MKFLRPIEDIWYITNSYGKRSPFQTFHTGIDLRTRSSRFPGGVGMPILSAQDGVVEEAKYHWGIGNHVTIDHGMGWKTKYFHLKWLDVKSGDKMKARTVIGGSGNTGVWSTGPHLHFEIHKNNTHTDPLDYLDLEYDVKFAKKHAGKIFLQVEENGEAWWIDPERLTKTYLGNPKEPEKVFEKVRTYAIGITNKDLEKFPSE